VTLLVVALGGLSCYGVNQMFSLVDELPKYSGRVRAEVAKISRKAQTLEAMTPTPEKGAIKVHETQSWTDLLSHGFGSAAEIILACSSVPFLTFFMLTWHAHARAAVGSFPLENRREAYSTMGQIATMVRSFILGNLFIAVLAGAVSTVVFALLKIPFFYLLGSPADFSA